MRRGQKNDCHEYGSRRYHAKTSINALATSLSQATGVIAWCVDRARA
jgi:hypothetical protein